MAAWKRAVTITLIFMVICQLPIAQASSEVMLPKGDELDDVTLSRKTERKEEAGLALAF